MHTNRKQKQMTSTFTTQRLVNSRTVVSGTDINGVTGSVTLDSSQWDDIKAQDAAVRAHESFDTKVEEFFAPLTAAAEKLERAHLKAVDPISFIVFDEGVQSVAGKAPEIVHLTKDSQVLRLLENNEGDRLIFVGTDIEILEVDIPLPWDDEDEDAMDQAVALVSEALGGVDVTDVQPEPDQN